MKNIVYLHSQKQTQIDKIILTWSLDFAVLSVYNSKGVESCTIEISIYALISCSILNGTMAYELPECNFIHTRDLWLCYVHSPRKAII